MLRILTRAYSWAKSSNTKPVYHKVLNISCNSCNLLNSVLKVKNNSCMGTDGYKHISCLPLWWLADCKLLLSAASQHHKRVLYQIPISQEKIKINSGSSLVAPWVKDPVFSLLWLGSLLWPRCDPWPQNSSMPQVCVGGGGGQRDKEIPETPKTEEHFSLSAMHRWSSVKLEPRQSGTFCIYVQLSLGFVRRPWFAETAWTSSPWFSELLQSHRNTDSRTPGSSPQSKSPRSQERTSDNSLFEGTELLYSRHKSHRGKLKIPHFSTPSTIPSFHLCADIT